MIYSTRAAACAKGERAEDAEGYSWSPETGGEPEPSDRAYVETAIFAGRSPRDAAIQLSRDGGAVLTVADGDKYKNVFTADTALHLWTPNLGEVTDEPDTLTSEKSVQWRLTAPLLTL